MLRLDGIRSIADRLGESVENVRKVAATEAASTQEAPTPDHHAAPATSTAHETPTGQPATAPGAHLATPHRPAPPEPAEEREASTQEEEG
ncbi:hypothetical protein [Streptomyces sp. NPDC004376]